MAIAYADVIVDLQSGDTGKGKIAHVLAATKEYDIVLRYNGGSNAGHTVYHNGQKVVTHQVPIGVLHGIKSIIGPGCVVNVQQLNDEIIALKKLGINTKDLIFVDKRAHIVTGNHITEDSADEKIGTTKQGIGPAYRDKYARTGRRIGDRQSHIHFEVIDIYDLLFSPNTHHTILCEGAQGFNLDIDWGEYPYVTSSHCTVGSACLNGIPPRKLNRIIGVMKAYETYVGNKIHFSDKNNPIFQKIQELGGEYGATTGRPRMVNWMNIDTVIKAMQINGVTDVIINKGDILRQMDAVGLIINNEVQYFSDYEQFKQHVTSVLTNYTYNIIWSETPNGI